MHCCNAHCYKTATNIDMVYSLFTIVVDPSKCIVVACVGVHIVTVWDLIWSTLIKLIGLLNCMHGRVCSNYLITAASGHLDCLEPVYQDLHTCSSYILYHIHILPYVGTKSKNGT